MNANDRNSNNDKIPRTDEQGNKVDDKYVDNMEKLSAAINEIIPVDSVSYGESHCILLAYVTPNGSFSYQHGGINKEHAVTAIINLLETIIGESKIFKIPRVKSNEFEELLSDLAQIFGDIPVDKSKIN